jgi:hypothetical protein
MGLEVADRTGITTCTCIKSDNGGDKLNKSERVSLESVKKDFALTKESRKFCKEV